MRSAFSASMFFTSDVLLSFVACVFKMLFLVLSHHQQLKILSLIREYLVGKLLLILKMLSKVSKDNRLNISGSWFCDVLIRSLKADDEHVV